MWISFLFNGRHSSIRYMVIIGEQLRYTDVIRSRKIVETLSAPTRF